ncbi:MAG: hypothetical protein ACREQ5_07610 [Candidatus Dormibacteria bacterium]
MRNPTIPNVSTFLTAGLSAVAFAVGATAGPVAVYPQATQRQVVTDWVRVNHKVLCPAWNGADGTTHGPSEVIHTFAGGLPGGQAGKYTFGVVMSALSDACAQGV